jgi:YfiH family protein
VRPVFLDQVHGNVVVPVDHSAADGSQADGAWAVHSGVACTVMVADCLPVLLTDTRGSFVAALHAGWRGLAGTGAMGGDGVLEAFFKQKKPVAPAGQAQAATEIIAWLGPAIGPDAFEVGDEVRQAFVSHSVAAQNFFRPHGPGKWLADLAGLARLRLAALGVTSVFGNDSTPLWCTYGQRLRFFSHRRDGVSGRFCASIWRA